MKLMTKGLEAQFKKIGCQENVHDPIVVAKFFYPAGSATWFATEYDPKEQIFFGWCSLFGDHNDEWGEFSLEELQQFRGRFGLGIERDLGFTPKPISKAAPAAMEALGRKLVKEDEGDVGRKGEVPGMQEGAGECDTAIHGQDDLGQHGEDVRSE